MRGEKLRWEKNKIDIMTKNRSICMRQNRIDRGEIQVGGNNVTLIIKTI